MLRDREETNFLRGKVTAMKPKGLALLGRMIVKQQTEIRVEDQP